MTLILEVAAGIILAFILLTLLVYIVPFAIGCFRAATGSCEARRKAERSTPLSTRCRHQRLE
jgi:hypothetical protein